MTKMFHLGVEKQDLAGATLAIIPGDPGRVEKIAQLMSEPTFIASHREFTLYLASIGEHKVVVCSTGIGGPSTSIAVEELAQLGVTKFLRVGTTGAIQPHIRVGDIIVTNGAVRLDGASQHFAPIAYPAVADFHCTTALVNAANATGGDVHVGITASSDTFYPGQERYDTYSGYVRKTLQGAMTEWQKLHVLNFEMESATLFTMCASLGLQAGCVAGVIINRSQQEIPNESLIAATEKKVIQVVVSAAKAMLQG
ncbi:uridine phosphorylase [Motilimonas pumila]|uniref:Uridine phosphorylase n=1 Tax=Motilimonas pumila TaxID=2303987 RepID=A0A418YEA8_9GAMM|nr:uridine phosphorylase [Motilimonas pumila]RJG47449.1 uridine phosphorylase [Motilimonas pumila]